MEISTFLHLLQNISVAVSGNKLTIDYDDSLQKIFEVVSFHDEAVTDSDLQSKFVADNFPPEEVCGRNDEKEALLSELIGKDKERIQISVIPIIGGCGIGKSTFARLVYDDELVKQHFEVRVWVRGDVQEFKLHQAAQGILKSAMGGMSCALDDLDELDEMVRDTLQGQRCLLVFDGIESMAKDSWLHMNNKWFDFVGFGSSVVITTTSKDVADLVSSEHFKLSQLSPDVGLSMSGYPALDMEVTAMGDNVSSLCQGNPLLLKLLGSSMRFDEKLRNLLSSVDFSGGIFVAPLDASIAVLLCVWGLPAHLRQCLAHCALFPRGYAIRKEKIIDLWIAQGLVKPSPGNNSLHDIGDSYFHQLLCRSFFVDITRNQYDYIIEFRIPCLVHKIAEDVARIVYKEKLGVIASISVDAGQLSLSSPFMGKYKLQDIRTLILSHTVYLDSILDHSLLDLQGLRSLDLSCSGIQCLTDDIGILRELRYLNLSYTLIERLPDSIVDLTRLQTLDLSWCYLLKVLPNSMRRLTNMSHLDLYQCESLSYLPSGIRFLIRLTSMPLFILGMDHDSACLGELGMLNHLRGRLEIRNLENVKQISEALDAKLIHKNIHHLGLSWHQNADDCFQILQHLQPNPCLRVLDIVGYASSQFPNWISAIRSLIKISITDCGCKELPSMGQLPFLKEMQLKGMPNLGHIGPEFYGDNSVDVFPSLEKLGLYDMPMLSLWIGSTDSSSISFQCAFRSLKTLTIDNCPQLQHLPSLPTLSDLIVCSSNKNILSSLTSFTSLSSLLINDMEMGVSNFQDLSWLDSLKKLILSNIKDRLIVNISHVGTTFTALEHLGILHCYQLTDLCLFYFSTLKKLHIVDCPNLFRIMVREEGDTPLIDLVVEDCPEVFSEIWLSKLHSLRKLILKNCGDYFTMYYAGEYRKLEKLEYLSINRCPRIEQELLALPSLISHIPCIIVGDHKANYKDIQDLIEVPIRAPHESKAEDLIHQRSNAKGGFERSTTRCFGSLCHERRHPFGFLRVVQRNNKDSSGVLYLASYDVMLPSPDRFLHVSYDVMAMKHNEIKKATRNFRPDMILGEGGFGTVYKGWIDEHSLTALNPGCGMLVAVRVLVPESVQGHQEWLTEKNYLSQLRHPNVIKLIGYCTEENTRILVYEYMRHGSLKNHLFTKGHQSLPWATRIKVAVGAARALSYMHELDIPVIHRDLKTSNILLDGGFMAKLSGFGLARDGPTADMTHVTTQVLGTFGFAAPEYVATGHLTTKCDVYGFGVVLVELLSGRRVLDREQPAGKENLVEWAKPYLGNRRKVRRIMDTRLEGQYNRQDAYMVAKIASQCLILYPNERPRMAEVVVALEQLVTDPGVLPKGARLSIV